MGVLLANVDVMPGFPLSNASLNSSTVANRSAGVFSSACTITASTSSGTLDRTTRMDGTACIVCRAMMAMAFGPVNGTCPTSISYSTHASA